VLERLFAGDRDHATQRMLAATTAAAAGLPPRSCGQSTGSIEQAVSTQGQNNIHIESV